LTVGRTRSSVAPDSLRPDIETDARGRFLGIEHEYRVLRRDGRQVEFRDLIHGLPIAGKRIDPGDTEAYRTESGYKITCDGSEAEIATPPLELSPSYAQQAAAWTGHAGQELAALLADRAVLEGGSTHISVSSDNTLVSRAAGMFSRTFAPALMLLMDAKSSPGLLVRPRHGRLEFGGEFVTGDHLSAALALAAGGAIVCERAAASFRAKAMLPPPIRVKVVRAVDRYGWYVGRDAFGLDLYERGRESLLHREILGTITAQECLEQSWASARAAIVDSVAASDLSAADDIVAGCALLPLESELDTSPPATDDRPEPGPLGQAMLDIAMPRFTLSASVTTWDFTVFSATNETGSVHVSVPTPLLNDFLTEVSGGIHDTMLAPIARAEPTGRVLRSYKDAMSFAAWDEVEFTSRLAPPERGPDGMEP
jgi:hypothetical protein